MGPLVIPEGGLSLQRGDGPDDHGASSTSKPAQIMRLCLAQGTLDELVASLQKDQKARIRLGKHPSLHYGNKSQPFFSSPETNQSEIYVSSPTSKKHLYFSGFLSHRLEVQKARAATAATDEALANLEQSLSAFERGKESKKTTLITTIDQMRALKAGDNRSANGREAASLTRLPVSKIDVEKERFFQNAANRSTSASPALLASRSPASISAITPTSATLPPNKDKIRLDALRVPFIHLLAMRPASIKSLSEQTRSSQKDCLALARKYCIENRQDREKFDLRDKVYKELDVWNFPYRSAADRQDAIDNAISAFDRMRISRQDKLWQILLPNNERGKGKVLSRLNLHAGPIPKSTTPRIHVQPSEDTPKEGYGTGNESDRTNGALTPNTGSLPAKPTTTQKKKPLEKSMSSKRAPAKPKAATLTGRVTKKMDKKIEKKSPVKVDAKFKSAEFVRDSDEEDTEMADAPAIEPARKVTDSTQKKSVAPKAAKTSVKPTPPGSAPKEPEGSSHKPTTKPQASKTVPSSTSTSRTTNSNSPRKPSPLGSSPPTNASDFEHARRSSNTTLSSSSSSPLISQLSRQKATSGEQSVSQTPTQVNSHGKSNNNPLKRKAVESIESRPDKHPRSNSSQAQAPRQSKPRPVVTAAKSNGRVMEPKRRRPSSPSSGSTTGSASPTISYEILRQKLREKSQQFKVYYAKYRALHEEMSTHPNPPRIQIEKLERQHARLQKMKEEIWDEDRRLRMG
ncbi:hypothetical protein AJ80_01011 [Polytolypa hystricis UAMH7299]|uniref:Uncharacterized protein n=1 Tax=Polytolypa hystricis (strain UAMH7299) TaxID=1447883 RepID=A0A2B7Z1V1_POLH7|nr:hypothetical protein AJ80_01011 [Polytolypa hystricis UAMH7299]